MELTNFTNYNALEKQIKELQEQLDKQTEEIITKMFKEFFSLHSNIIKKITWNQGYTQYNDNTYDFYDLSGDMFFHLNMNSDNSEEFFKLKEIEDDSFCCSIYDIEDDYQGILEKLGESIYNDVMIILTTFATIDPKSLIAMFGSNATVIVTSEDITCEVYYGD